MGMTAAFVTLSKDEVESINAGSEDVRALFHKKLLSRDNQSVLDIDKSWAAIHYLLTGSQYGGESPANLPIFGGAEIGGDLGYGPARILQPEEVFRAAAFLSSQPIEALHQRFDPVALSEAEIYPGVWEDGEEDFDYIKVWYELLRNFYAKAAASGGGMLIAII